MQKNIERLHKKQRTDAVRGVLLFGVFQLVCVAGFIMLCLIPDLPRWAVILFAACAAACAAPMARPTVDISKFSTFFSFLAIFQVLQCALIIF